MIQKSATSLSLGGVHAQRWWGVSPGVRREEKRGRLAESYLLRPCRSTLTVQPMASPAPREVSGLRFYGLESQEMATFCWRVIYKQGTLGEGRGIEMKCTNISLTFRGFNLPLSLCTPG